MPSLMKQQIQKQQKSYVNIIAVKDGNQDSDAIKALVKVLKSDDIKKFIDEKLRWCSNCI